MKASEIKKLVTGSKRVLIWVDGDGNQWIGDGMRGMYAVDDCIRLNEGNVLSVLDVDKDKRDKIRCSMGPSYDPRLSILPDEENDIQLRPVLSVYYADELITLMRSEDGELFGVRQSAIKPANAKYGLAFFLRRREGMIPWIACFEDMMTSAVLLPEAGRVIEDIMNALKGMGDYKIVHYEKNGEEKAEPEE